MKKNIISLIAVLACSTVPAASISTRSPEEVVFEESRPANLIEISDEATFDKFIAETRTPVVVETYRPGCHWCQHIAPVFAELVRAYPQIIFVQVSYDACEAIADKLDVRSFPTFFFYRNGQAEVMLVGAHEDKLRAQVAALAQI